MFRRDFIESTAWQRILAALEEIATEINIRSRNASNFESHKYCVGQLDMIDTFVELPNKLFTDGEEKPETKQPEGTVDLPNHPRPTRAAF